MHEPRHREQYVPDSQEATRKLGPDLIGRAAVQPLAPPAPRAPWWVLALFASVPAALIAAAVWVSLELSR